VTAVAVDAKTNARQRLLVELREHALVIGQVVLASGKTSEYLIDAELVAWQATKWEATAVGGMTMGADPIACAALAGGAQVKAFFVRKEAKGHGLSRLIEGPPLEPGERCMIVEDVVTTGGSTVRAIEAVRGEGFEICGVLAVCDRLAGGAGAIEAAAGAPFLALTTIDEVYPERPDRGA
jgi:orotate phosphoribosyltransferase